MKTAHALAQELPKFFRLEVENMHIPSTRMYRDIMHLVENILDEKEFHDMSTATADVTIPEWRQLVKQYGDPDTYLSSFHVSYWCGVGLTQGQTVKAFDMYHAIDQVEYSGVPLGRIIYAHAQDSKYVKEWSDED